MFTRHEFERISPESAGYKSSDTAVFLDELEKNSEMHSIMIMRHGKVFLEAFWSPYAPGVSHGISSHTKTYYATGIGVAITNGILSLDDRIIDYFPDKLPETVSDNLAEMKLRHVLSMTAGNGGVPDMVNVSDDYERNFLATPVKNKPGTVFCYNSHLSNMLARIFYRKTGQSLTAYMEENLYKKIGINPETIKCSLDCDGFECSGGGIISQTEDNLRLMKLYLDGGVWEGERILSEEYVKEATSCQISNVGFQGITEAGTDMTNGYGYQIWCNKAGHGFRGDGHFGIYTIAYPQKDIVIAITELEPERVLHIYHTLDTVWKYIDNGSDEAINENPDEYARLLSKVSKLSLPQVKCAPYSPLIEKINGKHWIVKDGRISFDDTTSYTMLCRVPPVAPVSEFSLTFESGRCILDAKERGENTRTVFAMDGTRTFNERISPDGALSGALCNAYFEADDAIVLRHSWKEGCYGTELRIRITEEELLIEQIDTSRPNERLAVASNGQIVNTVGKEVFLVKALLKK